MAFSQKDRLIRIGTPLGDDAFVVLSFTGFEEISDLFSFELQLASERNNITFEQLAGQNVTVGVRSSDGAERFFNGIIVEFAPSTISTKEGYSTYYAVMAPSLWLLCQCIDSRIFQNKSVPDIIKEVMGPASLGQKDVRQKINLRLDLSGNYPARQYCVQFNESDFAFISRLCECEGIHYFFEHENGRHTLVFADTPQTHKPYIAGKKETVTLQEPQGGVLDQEVIESLQATSKLTAGKYVARDYNFTIPDNDMTVQNSSVHTAFNVQGERYEYPGGYEKTNARGQTLAKMRMQAIDARFLMLRGRGNCRGFIPGFKFKLTGHALPQMNGKEYMLTKVRHEARQHFAAGVGEGDSYFNLFQCIPGKVAFRPDRKTPKPEITGNQTAIVTGPTAEEIHTDEYGRVKVKFHWDRKTDQKGDGNMSCWIRVSQTSAGAKFGAMHIPRVGEEVVIGFVDGDPDRPIIIGRLYHGRNKPPYDLPAAKTKSTFKSNSTKDGGGNANEIRFEDLKGSEEFYIHAARDRNEVVENDMSTEVKNNHMTKIKNNRGISVTNGNETHAVSNGGREVSVKSDEKHINLADFFHKVGGGYTLKVNGDITIDASGTVRITGAKVIVN